MFDRFLCFSVLNDKLRRQIEEILIRLFVNGTLIHSIAVPICLNWLVLFEF